MGKSGQATGRTRKATGQACCPWWVISSGGRPEGAGQATGKAQQAIPDGDLLTIANCGLPVV